VRVIVLYECSGVVRNAFVRTGHDAWSCDTKPEEQPRPDGWDGHYQGDVWKCLEEFPPETWDLIIAHPPCTYLCNSGIRWLYRGGRKESGKDESRWEAMQQARDNFRRLLALPVKRLCVENPRPHRYALLPKPTQYIQPWQFGHGETKETGLWLKGIPPLVPTNIVAERKPRVHYESPGPERAADRSRTLLGIADAMAQQWSQRWA